MYSLQIAHPNEVIDDRWITVLTSEEDVPWVEHLQSPIFEWYEGLCVRIVSRDEILYEGIYGRDVCVDVSPGSEVLYQHNWGLLGRITNLGGFGLLSRWKAAEDPRRMLGAIRRVVTKEQLLRVYNACFEEVSLHLTHRDRLLLSDPDDDERDKMPTSIPELAYEMGLYRNSIIKNTESSELFNTFNTQTGMEVGSHCLGLVRGITLTTEIGPEGDEAVVCLPILKEFSDIVRREIPFCEIACKLICI